MSWKKAKKETDLEEGMPFGPRLVGKERVGVDIEAKGANYLIYTRWSILLIPRGI